MNVTCRNMCKIIVFLVYLVRESQMLCPGEVTTENKLNNEYSGPFKMLVLPPITVNFLPPIFISRVVKSTYIVYLRLFADMYGSVGRVSAVLIMALIYICTWPSQPTAWWMKRSCCWELRLVENQWAKMDIKIRMKQSVSWLLLTAGTIVLQQQHPTFLTCFRQS